MKKSLIALAVFAVSGMASAQSTVTIYGLLDAYVGSVKTGGGTPASVRQTAVNSGGIQTSRFGLKGTEDLGGGLKANFQLESGFNLDTGAASAYTNPFTGASSASVFSRQSWVGLSGGFGELKVGKMWTPYDDLVGSGMSAFNANVFVPSANVWSSSNTYNDRPGNSIYYATPDFGGFTGAAMYSFGENKTPAVKAGKIASFNVAYNGGPLFVGLAYQTEKANGSAVTTKFTQLNGSYDFGVAKLLASYGNVKNGTDVSGVAAPRVKEYQIGADFPVTGAFTLSGGYARSKSTGLPVEIKHTGYGLMGLYAMSKRTNLYVGAQFNKQQSAGASIKGETIGAGVRHTF